MQLDPLYGLVTITALIIGLIYGIFALIPVDPFVTQNLSLGIILIVMSVTGMGIILINECCCVRQESDWLVHF
jgi:hypothetical protein